MDAKISQSSNNKYWVVSRDAYASLADVALDDPIRDVLCELGYRITQELSLVEQDGGLVSTEPLLADNMRGYNVKIDRHRRTYSLVLSDDEQVHLVRTNISEARLSALLIELNLASWISDYDPSSDKSTLRLAFGKGC